MNAIAGYAQALTRLAEMFKHIGRSSGQFEARAAFALAPSTAAARKVVGG